MKSQKKAYQLALLSVVCWSTVATAFKIALIYVDFLQLLLYSSFVSFSIFLLVSVFTKQLSFLKELSVKQLIFSALLGFLNPFLYYIILFNAYSKLPAQEAMTLNYTWPIMVGIFSIPFLKQKLTLLTFIAVIISFLGIIVIGTKGKIFSFSFSNPFHDFLAVSSSIVWAIYWLLNVKDKRSEIQKLLLSSFFGFLFTLIFALIISDFQEIPIKGIVAVVYVGVFEMGITFIFWLKALKFASSAAKVSQLIFLSPFLSLIIINLVLGERILLSTFIGMLLIISGIILQQMLKPVSNE